MINKLIKKYNALEGKEVSRDDLSKLSTLAFDAISYNEKIAGEIHTKLNKILDKYDKDKFVVKSLKKYSLQKTTPVNPSKQGKNEKDLPGKTRSKKTRESGLKAPRHNGAAKNALSECGRLKKGFRYEKGGKIVKVKKQSKKKVSVPKVVKKQKPIKPVKVDTKVQTALFGASKQSLINYEVVESTNMVLEAVEKPMLPVTQVLNAPVLEVPLKVPGPEVKKVVKQSKSNNPLVINFSDLEQNGHVAKKFNITGDLSEFLGELEIKPKHSLAITLDAEQGAGKTRLMFQAVNVFADAGYKCLFVSLEEHPLSTLFIEKRDEYINPKNKPLIDSIGELPNWYQDLAELIPHYDCIFIDSWNKISEEDRNVDFDKHLRKGFDGKLFLSIFQRTSDGKMRGGSKAAFDGDIILKMDKAPDYRNSFVYANKNRYQNKPLDTLKYNIYTKSLMRDNEPIAPPTQLNYEVVG